MSPKFKGGSDDWLDDEESVQFKRKKAIAKKPKLPGHRAQLLSEEKANAVVTEVFQKQCCILSLEDRTERLVSYRWAEIMTKDQNERTPVAVGDRVKVEGDVITALCERRNELSRPAPGREAGDGHEIRHVLAANVDVVVIVMSAVDPGFSMGVVDRFMIAALSESVEVILVVTKMDKVTADDERIWSAYDSAGITVVEVSRDGDLGVLESIRDRLTGRAAVFCGHSGVGKTSLLTRLMGKDAGRVGEINSVTGKGRHTTTGAKLLTDEAGSFWVDTPGVREFSLSHLSGADLRAYYPEFSKLTCNAEGCIHREGTCAARLLPRFDSYRRILESLLAGEG